MKNMRTSRVAEKLKQTSKGDRFVCDQCIVDDGMAAFIESRAASKRCSYCGRHDKVNIAAPREEVLEHLIEGIEAEWTNADNCLYYDGREGGFQGDTCNTYELLTGEMDLYIENESLLDDFCESMGDTEWCGREGGGPSWDEELTYGWDYFANKVKHETRYLFLHRNEEELTSGVHLTPAELLNQIGAAVDQVGLVKVLDAGTCIYRVRVEERGVRWQGADALGSPPIANATQSNRMSPAGFSMFYGAFDPETAILETWDGTSAKTASIAKFQTLRDISVLDLTFLPKLPSLFNENRRHVRPEIIFLRHFVTEVSKPIARDKHEHIEYVPTQVVSEYFRVAYKREYGASIDGIRYPSARNGNPSIVLFADASACVDDNSPTNDAHLLVLSTSATQYTDLPKFRLGRGPAEFCPFRSRASNSTD